MGRVMSSFGSTYDGQLGGGSTDSARNRPGDSDQSLIADGPAHVYPDSATAAVRSQHRGRFHYRSFLRGGCFAVGDLAMQPSSVTAETAPSRPTYTTAQVRFDANIVGPVSPSPLQGCVHHCRMWCTCGG
jgi:hypothetical protein